ncbi:MAG: DUF2281 domain-containing protein [Candidatus Caenarcaniphilales bacterium]|nr:DUF2281 domain-containing protein [Candidatus Caenarcaniphilales bacterium]
MLSDEILAELQTLPEEYQREVLDFALFLKSKIFPSANEDTEYLSKNQNIKQSIIDGMNTPLEQCSKELNW